MKLAIILGILFPIAWALLNGSVIKHTHLERNQKFFHGISLAGMVIHFAGIAALIPWSKAELYQVYQIFILCAWTKVMFFDPIVSVMLGKGWFDIGTTAVWDRFQRGYYTFVPIYWSVNWWKIRFTIDTSLGELLGALTAIVMFILKTLGYIGVPMLAISLWLNF